MTYEKFLLTLKINKGLSELLEIDLETFKDLYDYGDHITSVIFDILKKEAFTLLLPLIDEGIGAIHFHIDDDDIVIINTNQPICMMYFSTIHDLHHILFHNKTNHNKEFAIHLNSESYNTNPKERLASMFAASLLMPKGQLQRAYQTFSSYSSSLEETIIRLMIKFDSPLEAVLLRLFEINILSEPEKIEHLLNLSQNEIIELIKKYNQSSIIMTPMLIKDLSPIKIYEETVMQKQSLSEYDLNLLMNDLNQYINQIIITSEDNE